MLDQKVVDQALGVDTFSEETLGPGQLDGMAILGSRVHRQRENLNERQFGTYATRGFDTVHLGHRHIHQDDIRSEGVREGDRLESIGGLAHDLKLRPRLEQSAEGLAHSGVIVDDQDLQGARRFDARRAGTRRTPNDSWC